MPEGVEEIWIDPVDGVQVGERCDGAVRLPFLEGSGPERGKCGKSSLGKKAVRWFKGIFNDN
jgi:penicillin-binding protein 1B